MDIKKELLEIISEFVELPDEEIDTSKAFKSALGADSFVFLSMLGSIEERFNIRIPNEDLWWDRKPVSVFKSAIYLRNLPPGGDGPSPCASIFGLAGPGTVPRRHR